jgi:hypothetical protein
MIINSFWISGKLQPINILCIKSFIAYGHEFHLYCYDLSDMFNQLSEQLTLDELTQLHICSAEFVLPQSEIYYYKNMMDGKEHFKFGGIAERLKAELLYAIGGWHVDLDVVCLKSFEPLKEEYVFRPIKDTIVGNIIKAPAQSQVSLDYLNWTKGIDENNTEWSKSFQGLGYSVYRNGLGGYISLEWVFGVDELYWFEPLYKTLEYDYQIAHIKDSYAIHFCQAWSVELGYDKNYEQGSYYDSLLKKHNVRTN